MTKSQRLEVRTSPSERDLIDRAAEIKGVSRSAFVLESAVVAAQRQLADRTMFVLDDDAAEQWEAINSRPARDLPGLRRLAERPSPFVDEHATSPPGEPPAVVAVSEPS